MSRENAEKAVCRQSSEMHSNRNDRCMSSISVISRKRLPQPREIPGRDNFCFSSVDQLMSREAYSVEIRLDMEQKHCLQIACKRRLKFPIFPYFSQEGSKQKAGQKDRQCLICNGGAEGGRTLGLMTASHALSQLSYSPTWV